MTGASPADDDPFTGARSHSFDARIYYADTDFSGVVYYGRYLEYLERGRSDLLHRAGIRHRDLIDGTAEGVSEPLAWVVRRIALDYLGSARIEDTITVRTAMGEARGARLTMSQRVDLGGRPIVTANVEAALITLKGRPIRIPGAWIDRLTRGTSQAGTSQAGTSQGGTSQGGTSQGGTSQGGTSQGGTS